MKKRMGIMILLLSTLLLGCSAEDFEPMLDVYGPGDTAQPAQIHVKLPEDAALSAMNGETGTLYYGENYEVSLETYASGDINGTLRKITGRTAEEMTVLQVSVDAGTGYHCAWTAAGDEGERVGRCVVVDDGQYHYCLSVLADAEDAGQLHTVIDEIIASYTISS